MSVLFIADLHLGHKNIIYFRDNPLADPFNMKVVTDPKTHETKKIGFHSSEEHDQYLVDAWNKKVSKRDTVWILGDVAFTNDGLDLLSSMNGTKNLVFGNHDKLQASRYFKHFTKLGGAVPFKHGVLTHVPVHPDQLDRWQYNIHGHLHKDVVNTSIEEVSGIEFGGWPDHRYICVSADRLEGLAPISLDELKLKHEGVRW